MANLRIVPRNFHDEAVLSTQLPAASGFSVTNTQNTIRSRVWRSTGNDDQAVLGTFDDGLTRSADSFFMFLHNAQGANIQLELFSDGAWTTSAYSSGALPTINVAGASGFDWGINPYGIGGDDPHIKSAPYWLWFPRTDFLSYKITFTDHVGTFGETVWQASRFFLGAYMELLRNPAYGVTSGYADTTEANRSRGGSLRTNIGPIWRVMTFDLNKIFESERAAWLDVMRYVGTGRDFVLSLDPEEGTRRERDHTLNAKFVSLDPLGYQVRILTKRLQIQEV